MASEPKPEQLRATGMREATVEPGYTHGGKVPPPYPEGSGR